MKPGRRRDVRRCAVALAGLALGLACEPPAPTPVELRREERALVDVYVRIAVLEARHFEAPDSAEVGFAALAASPDSILVRRALAGLAAEPQRWEAVFDAIARELRRREESARPLADDTLGGAPPVSR